MAKLDPHSFRKLVAPHRVDDGKGFRLADHDPGDTCEFEKDDKEKCRALLSQGVEWLSDAQMKLYAHDRAALLLIFQAMDAAGKDSAIRHVMSGLNPQGCQVHSFKTPSSEERDHDFLWRHEKAAPERGRIGVFNRSYYEEVLVVRVHPELLLAQKLPPEPTGDDLWAARFEDIKNYEAFLGRNGTVVRKFFLNVSKKEQKKRFLERLDEPEKNWKFSTADVAERKHWKEYQKAYEDAIRNTATPAAPWFVVPADHKWYTRLIVAAAIVDALLDLELEAPVLEGEHQAELARAKAALLAEDED